jgi:hypothetical protein
MHPQAPGSLAIFFGMKVSQGELLLSLFPAKAFAVGGLQNNSSPRNSRPWGALGGQSEAR